MKWWFLVLILLLLLWTPRDVFGENHPPSSASSSPPQQVSDNTKQPETLRLEGDARLSAGDYAAAISLYTQALDSISTIRSSTTTTTTTTTTPASTEDSEAMRLRLLFKRAEVYFLQHNFKLALIDLDKLQSTDSRLLRARIHQKLGDLDQSLNEYEQISQNKEAQQQIPLLRSAISSLQLAHQAVESKNWKRCVDALTSLLSSTAYRDIIQFRLLKAECAYEARNQAELRNELNRIFATEPENVNALLLLAKSLYRLGATEEALSYIKRCNRYDPDNRKCREFNKLIKKNEKLWNTAEDSFRNHKFSEAIRQYQTYLDEVAEPFNKDIALSRLCHSFVEVRQADDAIRTCSQLTDSTNETFQSDTLSDAYIDRAEAFILKDDLEAAARDANRASEFNRNSDRVHQLNDKIQRLRKMASRKDFYKILSVSKTSSEREITKAYRRLATIYHPDRFGMSEETRKMTKDAAEKRFKEIVEAHDVLSDPEKRRRYDLGEEMDEGPGGAHHQPFHPFFQGGPGGGFTFHFG